MPRYLHIPHTPDTARTLTLSGRPLNGKPTKAGVYVKNGKKVVIE